MGSGVRMSEDRDSRKANETGVLKALCAGFFMQAARICSAGGGWLIVEENILVKAEGGSAIDGSSAEWVLYTELVGNTIAHVMMRTVSAVQHEWLKPLLPKLSKVDLRRLIGEKKKDDEKAATAIKNAEELAKEKVVKVSSWSRNAGPWRGQPVVEPSQGDLEILFLVPVLASKSWPVAGCRVHAQGCSRTRL